MANKIIIGILALLVILMGGIGYYYYTLSQQIDDLGLDRHVQSRYRLVADDKLGIHG